MDAPSVLVAGVTAAVVQMTDRHDAKFVAGKRKVGRWL
jgi:hypothetical protein